MRFNYKSACALVGLFLLLSLAACSQAPSRAQNMQPLTLNIGAEPSMLNPILSTDAPSSQVSGLIFSGLLRVSTNLELIADLAQRYEINKAGTVYTFYLNPKARWHDGQPCTAKDVKFTFETILDPKTNTVRRSNYMIEGQPIHFEVVDTYTVQAILPKPFAPFLTHMTMGILPKHLLANQDINTAAFNRQPIGTGPFVFDRWESAQYVSLKRNPDYFAEAPKLASILMKIIPDQNTALVSLEKGEIDQAKIPGKAFHSYQQHPRFNLYRYEDLAYTYMGFNLKHPLFKDKKIRQAIALAINKEAIVKGVLKGFGKPADIPASPVSWAYPEASSIKRYSYDPAASRRLLAEAGFRLNKQGLLERNGQLFSFNLITNKGNKDREKTAQLIQQFLAQVGIKMSIQLMEWSSFIKIVNENADPKKYDAVILGWSLGLDPDGYSLWHASQYPKGFNFVGYNNSDVNELLKLGRLSNDKNKRKAIYAKLYQHISQDLPYVFLYYPETLTGIQKRVKGMSPAGPAGLMNPIESVYLQP